MIRAFPKIFAMGTDYILDILKDEVEITEKLDGSQFSFGKIEGQLYMRSKGQAIFAEAPEKMFESAVEHVLTIQDRLPHGIVFYNEFLQRPKHNVLAYERIPKNHLALFAMADFSRDKFDMNYHEWAEKLDIEAVPVLWRGKIENIEVLLELLEIDSVLGNEKVEGLVVKNYERPFLLGGQPIPLMAGKYVSDKFKERHGQNRGKYGNKGRFLTFCESFRTEARWQKAVQHLRERGELENDPRDIGKLFKEVNIDIVEEEKDAIMKFLWKEFGKSIIRTATKGLPEWYKEQLLRRTEDDQETVCETTEEDAIEEGQTV